MGIKQIATVLLILQFNSCAIYSMEGSEYQDIFEEIELTEITDENRIKFFGKAEDLELFGYEIDQIYTKDNNNNNNNNFWDNLNTYIQTSNEIDKPLYKTLEKQNKNKNQQEYFPLENLPNDILIFIATLLVEKDSELVKKDKIRVENGPAVIYRDISYFLRTCKKFYSLKQKIDQLVINKLELLNDPSLQEKLEGQYKINPCITMAHIAVAYERMIWLTAWILKNKEDKNFSKKIINSTDTLHRTPLHWAAFYNRGKIIKILIKLGANIECKDFLGNTPLHMTTFRGSQMAAEALLALGANPNCKNNKKRTPLHEVAFKNNKKMAELLLNFKANVNEKDNLDRTPLHEAAINNSWESNATLLFHKADVDAQDSSGDTPLHSAAYFGHLDVARQLLWYKAKNTIVNYAFEKPTDIAESRRHYKLAEEIRGNDNCQLF